LFLSSLLESLLVRKEAYPRVEHLKGLTTNMKEGLRFSIKMTHFFDMFQPEEVQLQSLSLYGTTGQPGGNHLV
jgi:hypothetical protein